MNVYVKQMMEAGAIHWDSARTVVEKVDNPEDLELAAGLINEAMRILTQKRHEIRLKKLRVLAGEYVTGELGQQLPEEKNVLEEVRS